MGFGQFHATFQRLSRLDDEYGTRTMYAWLAENDVETHVYGVSDDPDVVANLDVIIHTDNTEEYRRSWVVSFHAGDREAVPEECPSQTALVAIEPGSNVYRGRWTYDRKRVECLQTDIQQEF